MPTVDIDEVATQILVAVISGILVQLVQPQWLRGFFRRPAGRRSATRETKGAAADGNHNTDGNQVVIGSGNTTGDITIDQRIDRSSHHTIITNINESRHAGTRDQDDDATVWLKLGASGVALLIGATAFILLQPYVLAVTVGATAGMAIHTVCAAIRTRRDLDHWPARATAASVVSMLAIAAVSHSQ